MMTLALRMKASSVMLMLRLKDFLQQSLFRLGMTFQGRTTITAAGEGPASRRIDHGLAWPEKQATGSELNSGYSCWIQPSSSQPDQSCMADGSQLLEHFL